MRRDERREKEMNGREGKKMKREEEFHLCTVCVCVCARACICM